MLSGLLDFSETRLVVPFITLDQSHHGVRRNCVFVLLRITFLSRTSSALQVSLLDK